MQDKKRNKEQGQYIGNGNKYGKHQANYINNNVSGLNTPIKKQRQSEFIKKKTQICLIYKKIPFYNIKNK